MNMNIYYGCRPDPHINSPHKMNYSSQYNPSAPPSVVHATPVYANAVPESQYYAQAEATAAQQSPQNTAPLVSSVAEQERFFSKYEINRKFVPFLNKLSQYRTVLLCDDSGSMDDIADKDSTSNLTRWEELKNDVKIILEAHNVYGTACDIYFINRANSQGFLNISSWDQISHAFLEPPAGRTNIVNTLISIWRDYTGTDMGKNLICHILTDGHPTNNAGQEDISGLDRWLRNRSNIEKTFISIVLCTDDQDIERAYRKMEFIPGRNRGIQNVDVSEDYRGECRDVRETRGRQYPFSRGDYIVKILCGSFDPSIHTIDLPQGCCTLS